MVAEVRVYLVNLEHLSRADLDRFEFELSSDERVRFNSFLRPQRALQFLVARRLLRGVLGRYLHLNREAVPLLERQGNRPRLLNRAGQPDQSEQVGFSLSHSGKWVACAVSHAAKLGLDIEVQDPDRNLNELARFAWGEKMVTELEALPASQRVRFFYENWTALEASLKLNAEPVQVSYMDHLGLAVTVCGDRVFRLPVLIEDGGMFLE